MAQLTTLLLTRPHAASQRFARQVVDQLGEIRIEISPLIDIDFLDLNEEPNAQTIVFTSRNGVDAWSRACFTTRASCFCVGEATADAARAIGFDPKVSGGTVEHLVSDVQNAKPSGEILHVHGRHTRGGLVDRLRAKGFKSQSLIAYEQSLKELSTSARDLLQGGASVIVPLFSPRSALQFASYGPFGPQVKTIAISKSAAVACPGATIAPHPDAKGMIAKISELVIA